MSPDGIDVVRFKESCEGLKKRGRSALGNALLCGFVLVPGALAQPYWVDRVAGNPNVSLEGIPAKDAPLSDPRGLAFDASGNLYISDVIASTILKVDTMGVVTMVAGTGHRGFSGDGGPATNASLNWPVGMAFDQYGSLYIADCVNDRIRKVDRARIITTVAGTGSHEFSGDGGPATDAGLDCPASLAFDAEGNLFISEYWNHRIRKIDRMGIITTVAGTGDRGFGGDGEPATAASLNNPHGIALDGAGNVFFSDSGNHRIRKIDRMGIITTVAGTADRGFGGDGGPATDARLAAPQSVAFDPQGNLYIADRGNFRIRKVTTAGTITSVAGGGDLGGDCGPASAARVAPLGLATDSSGRIYFSEPSRKTVRRLSGQSPIECRALPTPLSTWSVSPGEVSFASSRSRGCLVLSDFQIQGQTHVVHSSEWQRRAPGETAWTTVDGTLRAGRICAHTPTEPGEYRAVAEMSIGGGARTTYRSSNQIAGPPMADTAPSFGNTAIADQTYVAGTAISPLALPSARGGDGTVTYSLSPSVPGLVFDASARRLAGTPATAGSYAMRYVARDADGDTATLRFTITVNEGTGGASGRQYGRDDVVATMPTGSWVPDVTRGGSFSSSGGNVTIELNAGGYIEEGGYRYTCESAGGCEVVNRRVVSGTIVESAAGDGEADDHGDEPAQSTRLQIGGRVSGQIDSGHDVDYFRLNIGQRTDVAIYTTGNLDTVGSLRDIGDREVESNDDSGTGANFRIEATLDSGTHYVRVESYDTETGSYVLHVEERTATEPPSSGEYRPLDDWTVSDGRVRFLFFSAGRCISLGSGSTINGTTYIIHSSKWQRRANMAAAWTDVAGTERRGELCSYSPTEPGQYRGVAEISIGGTRGSYSSKNILTNP